MFGIDDIVLVLVTASLVNLVVEIGVEAVAAWVATGAPLAEPASDQARYELIQATIELDQNGLGLKAQELKAMADEAMIWSGQMINTLGANLGFY